MIQKLQAASPSCRKEEDSASVGRGLVVTLAELIPDAPFQGDEEHIGGTSAEECAGLDWSALRAAVVDGSGKYFMNDPGTLVGSGEILLDDIPTESIAPGIEGTSQGNLPPNWGGEP